MAFGDREMKVFFPLKTQLIIFHLLFSRFISADSIRQVTAPFLASLDGG